MTRTEALENKVEVETEYNRKLVANLAAIRDRLQGQSSPTAVAPELVLVWLKSAVNGAADHAQRILLDQQKRKNRVVLSDAATTRF